MAYCFRCGKEIPDGTQYCEEHSVTSINSQQIMPNVSFVKSENSNEPEFTVAADGTVAAQFGSAPQQANVPVPAAKKSPLWLIPIICLAGMILGSIISALSGLAFNALNNAVSNVFDYSFTRIISGFPGTVLHNIVVLAAAFASVIVYNKNCEKSGLADAKFPVFYGGIFYACQTVVSVLLNILIIVATLIFSVISNFTYLGFDGYDLYSVLSVITLILSIILTPLLTFLVFSMIQKKKFAKLTGEK